MGTPEFAVPSLNALHKNELQVTCVVTQPDRPKGRGRKLALSPVKSSALRLGYPVVQPESMNDDEVTDTISSYNPDLFVVIAYGHILPEKILKIPKIGAINIHASLLPKYRGSAPIHWSIINREKKTGVTSMFMDKGMDTGDILLTSETDIRSDETTETLHDRLAELGADLLIKTLSGLENNSIKPVSQKHDLATYAPLLRKSDGKIDWTKPSNEIEAFVRGMTPWPGAFTFYNDDRIKIFKVKILETESNEQAGTIVKGFQNELRVATGKGVLSILQLQDASGKRLSVEDYLKGHTIEQGAIFT
ncbi:MAG: methionyl-tRNA formyltransferase [Desulfobacterales bacterium]|nr:methionyl-tRNA formyltransferase [Desulfobacterales bacterium]